MNWRGHLQLQLLIIQVTPSLTQKQATMLYVGAYTTPSTCTRDLFHYLFKSIDQGTLWWPATRRFEPSKYVSFFLSGQTTLPFGSGGDLTGCPNPLTRLTCSGFEIG